MRRKPVSCEPCRKRKIKCERDALPCSTCLKRGYADDCIYQRTRRSTTIPVSDRSQLEDASTAELLERIRSLEAAVLRNSENQFPTEPPTGQPSRDTEKINTSHSPDGTMQGAVSSESPTETVQSSPGGTASRCYSLTMTRSGHERLEWGISPWPPNSGLTFQPNSSDTLAALPKPPSGIFSFVHGVSRPELLACLPSMSHCVKLKDVYFHVFSPLFHVLHDPTFDAEFAHFREDPEAAPTVWLALLFVVLAIAVTALEDDNVLLSDLGRLSSPAANRDFVSTQYRSYALKCLVADDFIAQHNLKTLQTLVLLIYSLNHAHKPSFPLLGLAQNIAFAIGAHIDPERFGLSLLQCEERRRCWAGLFMLRTIQHSTLFMTDTQEFRNEVKLPADIDDLDLMDPSVHSLGGSQRWPTQMTYMLFKFGLYKIMADICRLIYTTRHERVGHTISGPFIESLDRRIAAEQERWSETFRMAPESPIHHLVHLQILYMYAHQMLLLLHRPSAAFNTQQSSSDRDNYAQSNAARRSRTRCVLSALQVLQIHAAFDESDQFRFYHWYHRGLGSFHAFHASVVLGAALLSGLPENEYNHVSIPFLATRSEMMSAIHASLERFKRLASRSEICRRAAPVVQDIWDEVVRQSRGKFSSNSRIGSFVYGNHDHGNGTHHMQHQQHQQLFSASPQQGDEPSSPSERATGRTNVSHPDRQQWSDTYQPPASIDTGEMSVAQFESLLENLHPESWLTPFGDPWAR